MAPLVHVITDREEEVLLLLGDGHGEREIAVRLGISRWTVRAHRSNARRKLSARTTTHAVAIVVRAQREAVA